MVIRNTITNKQISAIFAISNAKEISNENLHIMVYENFQKEHVRELTKWQGSRLITFLNTGKMPESKPWKSKFSDRRSKMTSKVSKFMKDHGLSMTYTPGQKWKIHQLIDNIRSKSGYKLNDLAERIIGKPVEPEWKLTSSEASKLIAGLNQVSKNLS